MKKITFLTFVFGACTLGFAQQNTSTLSDADTQEIEANNQIQATYSSEYLAKMAAIDNTVSKALLADLIPIAGATETFTPVAGDFFFDPGGPGGTDTDGGAGNYPNCNCITTSTLQGITELTFDTFNVFATFDWIRVYDGADITGTVLYDNNTGGANAGDITLADMIASAGSSTFTGTSGDMTIELRASGVVNREGYQISFASAGGGDFPAPYCGPLEFNFDVEPITLVSVADINNVSDATVNGSPEHEDFTNIVGNMEQGVTYPIALEGNTGGNFTNRFAVFIDWNQNDILDDAGEVYEILETLLGSTGTDGQQATGDIIVPVDALEGETRMRVKKIFGTADFLDPCAGAGFGQAEDYTINVSAAGGDFPAPYCGPLEFNFDVEPITLVSVADINNVSDATVNGSPEHEDFTDIVGNMEQGVTYPIALEGNTGGNFTNRFAVFIDWNQNEILDDAGEVYEILETLLGSTGTDGQQATGDIIVPVDALEGETRMRVKKIFGTADFLDPCAGAGFGQAEDYTINVSAAGGGDLECGGLFLDSGGVSEVGDLPADTGYQNNENETYTILPDNPGEIVTVTFTYVDIESGGTGGTQDGCWDFLTVYDGPDTSSPVLAATLCGEESGDGSLPGIPESLLSVGDSFTSSHPSGALTFVFTSDGSVQQTGWEADITCELVAVVCEAPENLTVSNETDTTADFTWDAAPTAVEGYSLVVALEGEDATVVANRVYDSGLLPAGTLADTATGLSAEVAYDAYIVSVCDITDVNNPVIAVSDALTFNTVLNTTSFETESFTMFPNPADGFVTFRANVALETLEVYSLLGQVVLNKTPNATEFSLDVSQLQTGTYFVRATANGVTTTQKLIKR